MRQATLISLKEFRGDPRHQMDQRVLEAANNNGFPVVAGHIQRRDHFGLLAGAALALVLGGTTFWLMSSHRTMPARVVAPTRPVMPVHIAPPTIKPAAPSKALPALDDATRRIAAPTLIMDTGPTPAASAAQAARTAQETAAKSPKPAIGPLSADEAFAERVGNDGVDTASATAMADPTNTVVQGVMIPAVLETAINSDLPGYARAIVSQDVRSFDGSKVLIPRASHLIGQYKSGVADGQRRLYILWSRLIRPDGVSVALASPTTDFSGKTGIAGDVDTHFFARFGSAILLSVVDLFAAVGSASVIISGGTSPASVVAQQDSKIPPTITVPQGTPIRIFTARDLDFSTVGDAEMSQK
jgi:type IV secretion system protein VirB10